MPKLSHYRNINLCARGYHMFRPDIGIYCGGFPGPLYPQPSTLFSENGNINPIEYQQLVPTAYTMKTLPNVYDADDIFGPGNPGINYYNPGHIIGLLDTFGRFSFGFALLNANMSQQEYETEDPQPMMDINLQLLAVDEPLTHNDVLKSYQYDEYTSELGLAQIYDKMSEAPPMYINTFVEQDTIAMLQDPENGAFHIPETHLIEWEDFRNRLYKSYYHMPETFKFYLDQMASIITTFNDGSTIPLDGTDLGYGTGGETSKTPYRAVISDMPWPLGWASGLPEHHPEDLSFEVHTSLGMEMGPYNYYVKATTLTPQQALKIMYNQDDYVDLLPEGDPGETEQGWRYRYRALHQMNAIHNIMPIQTHGLRYGFARNVLQSYITGVSEWEHRSFIICDIIFFTNIPQNINIRGEIIFQHHDDLDSTIWAQQWLDRRLNITTKVTNKYNWNKMWFGMNEFEKENEVYEDRSTEWVSFVGPPGPIISEPITQEPPTPEFRMQFDEKCVVPDDTGHHVICRIIADSVTSMYFPFDHLKGDGIFLKVIVEGEDFIFQHTFDDMSNPGATGGPPLFGTA